MFKKLFSYIRDLFKSDEQIIAEAQAGAAIREEVKEAVVEAVVEEVKEVVESEPTKEIEERLVEVAKEDKPVTAKEIKA